MVLVYFAFSQCPLSFYEVATTLLNIYGDFADKKI